MPVAVAVEQIHIGTLLHDDVIDEGTLRRNRPSARLVWGNSTAILSGDFCFFAALEPLVAHGDLQILSRAMKVARALATGELAQLRRRIEGRATSRPEYEELIANKTGSLFSFACWGGARTSSANARTLYAPDDFGMELGLAFQILDDLLDVTGDPLRADKALGRDLAEGMITLPALDAADDDPQLAADLQAYLRVRTKGMAPRDLEATAQALNERVRQSPALDKSRARVVKHAQRSLAALGNLPPGPGRTSLTTFADTLLERALKSPRASHPR
jgi:geranylgeranyl pyrophosphate synthase